MTVQKPKIFEEVMKSLHRHLAKSKHDKKKAKKVKPAKTFNWPPETKK